MQEVMQAQQQPQGIQGAQGKSSAEKLQSVFTNYKISECPTDPSKVTVMDKNGNFVMDGTPEEVYDKLKDKNQNSPTAEGPEQTVQQEQQQVQQQEQPVQQQEQPTQPESPVRSQGARQAENKPANNPTFKGDILHKTADGDIMTKEVKNGKTEYHYYQYDKKNGTYTETDEKTFRSEHNTKDKQVNVTALKNGSYTTKAYKQGQRIKGQQGRYAEQNPKTGEWNFYAQDGTKLKPEYIKTKDPGLYNSTTGQATKAQQTQKGNPASNKVRTAMQSNDTDVLINRVKNSNLPTQKKNELIQQLQNAKNSGDPEKMKAMNQYVAAMRL